MNSLPEVIRLTGYSLISCCDRYSITLKVYGFVTIGRTPQGLGYREDFQHRQSLKEFKYPLEWEITELYAFNEKSVSASELLVPDDAHIDLAPLIREDALLEIPIKPLHDPECKGLCIECGPDLNLKDCGHSQDKDDSPFATLKDLLN
ncbi:MAG TPA: DUF177 domain-containing protein [Anaerolineales bacterium]|nr:DUF177 domain-containing protein [Anaerolineales bacterium]